jgi:hypothetical protein
LLLWTLGAQNLLGCGWWKARPNRLAAVRAGKSGWSVTISEAYDGRSAIEATIEPPAAMSRNQVAKISDER